MIFVFAIYLANSVHTLLLCFIILYIVETTTVCNLFLNPSCIPPVYTLGLKGYYTKWKNDKY